MADKKQNGEPPYPEEHMDVGPNSSSVAPALHNDDIAENSGINQDKCYSLEISQSLGPNKTSSAVKKRGQFRAILHTIFSKEALQLMLSHHPNCEKYDDHVFKIGKLRLCKGCTLGYPPAYTIIFLFLFWPSARNFFLKKGFLIQNIWWFVISFGFLTIIGYLLKRLTIVIISDLTKLFRGILAGSLVVGVLAAPRWYYKIIPAVLVLAGLIWLSLKRGTEMERTCNECEWKGAFEVCPGFSGFYQRLNECSTEILAATKQSEKIEPSLVAEEHSSPGVHPYTEIEND